MAAFFGNRPSYVTASWANQRIYPRTEPSFAEPSASPPSPAAARRSSSSQNFPPVARTRSSVSSPPPPPSEPTPAERPQLPPLYYPGANRDRALSQSDDPSSDPTALPPNHIPSINSASTRLSIVPWLHHPISLLSKESNPSLGTKLKKWCRLPDIWTSLKQEPEELYDGWPVEFGGKPMPTATGAMGDEESGGGLSRFSSRRSGTSRADSGIVLPRRSSAIGPGGVGDATTGRTQHPLEPLYRKRIAELNTLISEGLVLSRGWLALTELMWIVWFVALIVALGQGRGVQTGFLKGVEIGLVCVIILSALAINGVRMRRWKLAEYLRKRTRDWSPLPITSSTNTQLMRNYLDGDADPREIDAQRHKDSPVLRWRLREIEGGYWIAYRPVIRCELITPATRSNPQGIIHGTEQRLSIEEEGGAGTGAVGDGEAAGVLGELPPGYDDETRPPRD
ncbi:hypothetical protein JCM11491_000999 [Sporobolomyces phaffii]